MTAGTVTVTAEAPASVAAVRSFIGKRRRRSWVDWYIIGFAFVFVGIYGANFLAGPLSRLTKPASAAAATHAAAAQAVAGAGVVIGIGAGLLLLAQALGPLALSPADASWLLLTPLRRRAVLRRAALTAAAGATVAGALLGVLCLAMAGPYLRLAHSGLPGTWLFLSAVAGAGCCLAAVAGEALAQPRRRPRAVVRASCLTLAIIAMAGAVAGERWTSVSRAVTTAFGALSATAFDVAALTALALAAIAWLLLWRKLSSFPAGVLRADSARSGRALLAAQFLNLSLLSRIADDNHWRGHQFRSKPWPRLPPALVLAWADWRRLRRRPGPLVFLAVATVLPALLGAAITGRARLLLIIVALVAGALVAGAQGTAAAKRDLDDPALRRLLGVSGREALAVRAVLPSLLSSAWLVAALALLSAVGVLTGWLWPLLGLVAGPGVTAAVLRLARTAPIDPTDQGPNTALGTTPPWAVSRLISVALGAVGLGPLLAALLVARVHASTITTQIVFSAAVLWLYLMAAERQR